MLIHWLLFLVTTYIMPVKLSHLRLSHDSDTRSPSLPPFLDLCKAETPEKNLSSAKRRRPGPKGRKDHAVIL